MKNQTKIIRETNTVGGCTVSVLSVKYQLTENCPKIDAFFEELARKYCEFVKQKCFINDIERFEEYLRDGGRRSKFPRREYFFSITEQESGRDGYRTFRTEIICTDGGKITDYSLDCKTWRVHSQTICLLSELSPKRPKESYDGFYLRSGETVFYKISSAWREKECTLRNVPSFEIRILTREKAKTVKKKRKIV